MQISTFQKFTEKFTEALPASSKKMCSKGFLFTRNIVCMKFYLYTKKAFFSVFADGRIKPSKFSDGPIIQLLRCL
jgi:hypothetical protein